MKKIIVCSLLAALSLCAYAQVKVSGDLFYPRYTALGAGHSAKAYFAGRMRRLSVELR